MKILNVQLKHIHGGNPQASLDYCRAFKQAGNEVTALVNPSDPFIKKLSDIGVNVILSKRLGDLGPYDIFSTLYFRKIAARTNPDIIIVHEGRSAALVKRAVGYRIPIIDVNHGRSPKQSRDMDATIVINHFQEKRYNDFFKGVHKVFYIPNFLCLDRYEKPRFPQKWNDPPVIGMIGRLVVDKAVDVFIDALAILNDKSVNFTATIAGDGEERASIFKQIKENRLEDKVAMVGWINIPDEFYKKIDIFCFPSRKEEFGLVLLEAYKHGLPVVVSDADGPSEIVENGKDAIMVPKENPEALAAALQTVLQNKKKADSLAKSGYEKVISMYAIPVVAKSLQAVLEDVASTHRKNITS